MTAATTAEVVVIGLGAFGSATLYQLAKRGIRAVGIDLSHFAMRSFAAAAG